MEHGYIDPHFSICSLLPTDPLFSICSHPLTIFLLIHNQFLIMSHQMTPFLATFCHFHFFFELLSKICPNLYFAKKICQNLSYTHHLTPFFGLLTAWPLFRRKINSHSLIVLNILLAQLDIFLYIYLSLPLLNKPCLNLWISIP